VKGKFKRYLVFLFLGGIMVTSGILVAFPGINPEQENPDVTITGTPADNYPDAQRAQFCGEGLAKSTQFVTEYQIPTECTNPLAITTDFDGNVWVALTNTGNLAKFDVNSKQFKEFDNSMWPKGARSMMWGMDIASDDSIWYTDEQYDSVWKFTPSDAKYQRFEFPSNGDSLPQKLSIMGSKIIINDFTGNKIAFLDPSGINKQLNYLTIPSPINDSVTAGFAVDKQDNVWFTNWIFQQGGALVKFDQNRYFDAVNSSGEDSLPLLDHVQVFQLPLNMLTPNGATFTDDGLLWLADTTSSSFFSFNPETEKFTQYVTATPLPSTYGNQTGVVKEPISRPYWIKTTDEGLLVFNAQTANNISVMNPNTQTLVEYQVPSKNPYWSDCNPGTGLMARDCGIAQVFDFAISGDKIWFSEWVENNIGVVDTSVPIPFDVELNEKSISLAKGEEANIQFTITSKSDDIVGATMILKSTNNSISATTNSQESITLLPNSSETIDVTISLADLIEPGTYKILMGAQTSEVASSQYLTVTIE
jgi:virginiamycin B lyase